MSNEELAIAIKAGNEALILDLWQQCKGYIAKYGYQWQMAFNTRSDVDLDDFIQSGYIALVKAIDYFNSDMGMSFIGVLRMHLKTAFSDCLGIGTERGQKDPLNNYTSLDEPLGENFNGETIVDTIAVEDEALTAIEENSFKAELYKLLHEAVDELPQKQRYAIEQHYFHSKQINNISADLGVSKQSIHEYINTGKARIRRSSKGQDLKEMYSPDRNYYRNTGLNSFLQSGMSSPERELIYKEILKKMETI